MAVYEYQMETKMNQFQNQIIYLDANNIMLDYTEPHYETIPMMKMNEVETQKNVVELGRTGRPKRIRTNFTSIKLAAHLKLTDRTVKVWFQNRRMKLKRDGKKIEQQPADVIQVESLSPSQVSNASDSCDSYGCHRDEQATTIQQIRENLMRYQVFNTDKNHGAIDLDEIDIVLGNHLNIDMNQYIFDTNDLYQL